MARPTMRLAVLALVAGVALGCGGETPTEASGAFTCVGVPAAKCQGILADARQRGPVVAIQIRCDASSCTTESGTVAVVVVRANGAREEYGSGWGAAVDPGQQPPIPTPPVRPICLGLPAEQCANSARDAMSMLGTRHAEEVIGIVITCKGACTPTDGEGDTKVTFRDGTTLESSWGYESGS